jgi:uncharacterized membrane protein
MQFLGLSFVLSVLAANLWGLTLAAGLYWRSRWLAAALGPLLAVTAVYALECHWGLGRSLSWLLPPSTAASAFLIWLSASPWEPRTGRARLSAMLSEWRSEFAPRRLAGVLGVGAGVFLYAFVWRFLSPDIDGSSEKIADLSYICSYYPGGTIPVRDVWYTPFPSTHYYSLQHYAAALMGRILALRPGEAYNLGFCVLIALGGTAFAGTVAMTARRAWVRVLLVLGFVIGGPGTTLFVHLTEKSVNPWVGMRFIGSAPMDGLPLGPWVKAYQSRFQRMDLPGEPFAYSIYLGDYHAPLSGYYLLGVGAMATLLWWRTRQRRHAAVVGATLTWTLLANTWLLPLQGLCVAGLVVVGLRDWRRLLPPLAGGAALVWALAWRYLSAFTQSVTGNDVVLRMVPWAEHSPPLLFGIFLLPTLALMGLGLVSGTAHGRRLCLLWASLLAFSEFFYMDDVYSGPYDRFNTTLKWWPWIAAGTLMTLGPVVLEGSRRRWVRWTGAVFCLYPCFYILDIGRPLLGPHPSMGHIEGSHYLTKDEFPRLIVERLRVERPGIVVEHPDPQGGFVNSSVVPLLAGQSMWIGWFGHELLWRGYPEDIFKRHDFLMKVYAGQVPDAGRQLLSQDIDYVLWYRQSDTPDLWAGLNRTLAPQYVWCELLSYVPDGEVGPRVGFWRRAPPGTGAEGAR